MLFASSAPSVQIFIPAMRAFDRSQLIIKIRQRFGAWWCRGNSDDSPARFILTQPPYVNFARHHLLRPDIDVAQRGRGDRFVRWRTLTFCWTFDGHCRLPRKTNAEARLGLLLASVSRSLAEVARFGPSWIAVLRRPGRSYVRVCPAAQKRMPTRTGTSCMSLSLGAMR